MRVRFFVWIAAALGVPLILIFALVQSKASSAPVGAPATQQDSSPVITLQPTVPPTAATVATTTSTTTTTEPPLPTLPTTTRPPATPVIGPPVPTTTILPPLPASALFGDPTLMPVCQSALPPASVVEPRTAATVGDSPTSTTTSTTISTTTPRAPTTTLPPGANCRIVAYYGNPLSKGMGVLGQYPVDEMLQRLAAQTEVWRSADPATRTQCALELIAVTAQAGSGPNGLYRARMKPAVIEAVIGWARSVGCLTILDVQVGRSTVASEVDYLRPWLKLPDVHLALDPEWDMPPGIKPGTRIGTMDAADINGAIKVLDEIVKTSSLGPKLLTVHRFRDFMVTNPTQITVPASVRLLVNMDGFGPPKTKLNSYRVAKTGMPTTLTGFKLFYKNDVPMMGPADVLPLAPIPMFINYQ